MNRIDPGKARLRSALGGHRGGVFSVAFGPAGALLVTAGHEETVRLWGLEVWGLEG